MTMVLAFLFMLAIVTAMSVGVMMGRKPIAGSCGGMQNLGIGSECEICGGNPAACDSARRDGSVDAAKLSTDAASRGRHVRTL
ncbi:MAG: (Na+)-NQR maturation NqrM [Pseudomonadota bacterium]